ncbi:thioredoxin family protein [Streptomyces sp. NPDC002574]|uniref:thioredoxin family protein n=1 Tax=Streptomyces sp. NPDC002574 TaxID=3364652 RepID=UPI0036CC5375
MSVTSVNRSTTVACGTCGRTNRVPVAAQGRPRCGNCGAALPWIVDAGDDDFDGIAGTTGETAPVVLVDLWATWCGPCRLVSPALERVARQLAGRLKLVKVDIDRAPAIAQRFQVMAVPTLVLLGRGEEIARRAGAAPDHELRRWVEESIADRG